MASRRSHHGRCWELILFVANGQPRSAEAGANLTKLYRQYLAGHYKTRVVDLLEHPKRSAEDRILALLTVLRRWPLPETRVIGVLSNTECATAALGLRTAG